MFFRSGRITGPPGAHYFQLSGMSLSSYVLRALHVWFMHWPLCLLRGGFIDALSETLYY